MKSKTTKQGVRDLNSLASKKKPKLEMPPAAAFGEQEMSDYDAMVEMLREYRS
jgi:hypothetical protein